MLLVVMPDLFSRVLLSFWPALLATPLPLLFWAPFALFSPSKSAWFCRAKATTQSLERGSFRTDLSTKFRKEIPSRNLYENRSDAWAVAGPVLHGTSIAIPLLRWQMELAQLGSEWNSLFFRRSVVVCPCLWRKEGMKTVESKRRKAKKIRQIESETFLQAHLHQPQYNLLKMITDRLN